VSAVGSGSAPGTTLPTVLVALVGEGVPTDALEARLRTLDPPVIARIEHDHVLFDLRTVQPWEDGILAEKIPELMAGRPEST
jgi:L-seryl-tRNA(Ser) seleniumtransferase